MQPTPEQQQALNEFATAKLPTSPMKTKKIRITKPTPVDLDQVVRCHTGRLQPYHEDDPLRPGRVQFHFPVGTILEIVDYVANGYAEDI